VPPNTIAYLGPAGTWSEQAAMRHGGAGATLLPLSSFPAVVSAVETGLADAGVLAIENSLEGAVGTTLDLLIHETELSIVAEVVLPIRHMLLARPETALGDIRVLRSHPQTLGQCRRFIERVLPKAQTAASLSNTAAVEEMLEEQNSAAISTPRAAELYPVQILARDIQDRQTNETRFVVLAPSDAPPTGDDKTSLAFSTSKAERPGALVALLNEFAMRSINLTKLESRPARERLGHYIFLCDLDGHREDAHVAEALRGVAEQADWLKVFGSYPAYRNGEVSKSQEPRTRNQ
jgi:prephenate dehydratase